MEMKDGECENERSINVDDVIDVLIKTGGEFLVKIKVL